MDEVMQYVIECADKGDLAEFLEKCDKTKKYIYKGNDGLDLQIVKGKVVKVLYEGRELKLVAV